MSAEVSSRIAALTPAQRGLLLEHLGQFLTGHRQGVMRSVLAFRTRHLCVVLEDLYQPHNASAVLRSCDCYGVQDVHILERRYRFEVKKTISLGAAQWLTLHRYRLQPEESSAPCLEALRRRGYQIVATTLRPGSRPIDTLDVARPVALCFGTEEEGLSDAAHDAADAHVHLPMYGFTQSFNISVTVALCLQILTQRIRACGADRGLSDEERQEILLGWTLASVPHPEHHVDRWLASL